MVSAKTCSIEGCDRPFRAKGMCSMHLKRRYRSQGQCIEDGCDSPVVARGLCNSHYLRLRRAKQFVEETVAPQPTVAPVLCPECGRAVCADPDAGPVLIAAARANHRRYCKKETAA